MTEAWAPIFDGRYAVSTLGRVKRLLGGKGATEGFILKTHRARGGYRHVWLRTDPPSAVGEGRRRYRYRDCFLHDLVLSAHVRPRQPGEICRHRNGDRADNRVANLYWHKPLRYRKPTPPQERVIRRLREAAAGGPAWELARDEADRCWLALCGKPVRRLRPDTLAAVQRVLAARGEPAAAVRALGLAMAA